MNEECSRAEQSREAVAEVPERGRHRARPQALAFGGLGFGLFQRVTVFAFEAVAGGKVGLAVVVFPNLVVNGLTRLAAQRALLQNAAFRIAVQLDPPRLLKVVQAVGQNHQYFSLHNCYLHRTSTRSRLA